MRKTEMCGQTDQNSA